MKLRVLIACEFSGVVRRAFRALGHEAWSCDVLPAEDGSPFHLQTSIFHILCRFPCPYDLMIAHPPCRYLCNSGAKHLYIGGKKENGIESVRWEKMEAAAEFYNAVKAAPIEHKAIENSIMHGEAMKRTGAFGRQFVQPWWFGHPEFKASGWELINLPRLVATDKLTPPKPGTEEHKKWSRVHRAPPGPDRWKTRSRTLEGPARAMAEQWSAHILQSMRQAA
jgi:hypothetical protein